MSGKSGELRWFAPSDIEPNSYNPNRMNAPMYAKELQSIQDHGFVDPITAWIAPWGITIIDGEHRWRAAMDLGLAEIPVFIVDIDDENTAKKLTILLNELRGQALPEKMGDLLKDLMGSTSVEDLLRELPYTEDMFRGFTDLPPLTGLDSSPSGMAEVAQSEPERRWVERLYRLPLAAATVLDDAIARAKAGDDIEDWQALERMAGDFLAG